MGPPSPPLARGRCLEPELAVAGGHRRLRHQHPFAARIGGDLADRLAAVEHLNPVARRGPAGDHRLARARPSRYRSSAGRYRRAGGFAGAGAGSGEVADAACGATGSFGRRRLPRKPMTRATTITTARGPADPSQTMRRTLPPSKIVVPADFRLGRACLQSSPRAGGGSHEDRRLPSGADGSDPRGAMQQITRLCVYCGSAAGPDPFTPPRGNSARRLRRRASNWFSAAADRADGRACRRGPGGGGRVVGIIPDRLRAEELAHPGRTELVIAGSMHDRKRADGRAGGCFRGFAGRHRHARRDLRDPDLAPARAARQADLPGRCRGLLAKLSELLDHSWRRLHRVAGAATIADRARRVRSCSAR